MQSTMLSNVTSRFQRTGLLPHDLLEAYKLIVFQLLVDGFSMEKALINVVGIKNDNSTDLFLYATNN